jgi:hypothetical protein
VQQFGAEAASAAVSNPSCVSASEAVLVHVQVLAESNKKLQALVNQIVESGDSNSAANLVSLSTKISKLAAVQQDDMSTSIATLASSVVARYAADPAVYNPSLDLAQFSTVSQHG